MSTTQNTKKKRQRAAAVVLLVAGVAGLGAASASQLTVSSSDGVASGTSVPVAGLSGATATVKTVPAGNDAPDASGAVPVDVAITVTAGFGQSGMVYVNDEDGVPFTVGADASTPAIVEVAGLDSHDTLTSIGVVITS
ncbi:hypothetical protein Cch01nite_32940 [Cellulomonas chitinilytica]|uniref:Uncharacterized protein n=1 Tax=Cellulomonas chitinilytica TaxID=398759 RepID=A0A919P4K1_9CELL|nr:hypothetical protein [Cellulomonas chitinilytica]GIG22570.1 hypothetical protein Cch01nite_32940 [Cellulomonas chitinilytica]